MPNQQTGILGQIDMNTVVHAAIIALVIVLLYHFLFQR